MSKAAAFLRRILAVLRTNASDAVHLLGPRAGACAVCGGAAYGDRERQTGVGGTSYHPNAAPALPLCRDCRASIPWLDRIVCKVCGRGIRCDDCRRRTKRAFVCNRSAVEYSPSMREWLALYKYRGNERLGPVLAEMLSAAFERLTEEIRQAEAGGGSDFPQVKGQAGLFNGYGQTSGPATLFRRRANEAAPPDQIWDAVTYVPISEERAEERGFNQAERLASYLAGKYRCGLYPLLNRKHHSGKMSFKSRAERLRDAAALFAADDGQLEAMLSRYQTKEKTAAASARESNDLSRPRILLVDDIYTTGSTAQACSLALQHGAGQPLDIYVLTWARS